MSPRTRTNLLLGAAAVAALGSFLPWVTVTIFLGTVTANGMDGDGKITLGIAAVLALVAWFARRWALIPALALTGIAIYEVVNISSKLNDMKSQAQIATSLQISIHGSIGIGVWLILAASLVATAVSFYGLRPLRGQDLDNPLGGREIFEDRIGAD